MGTPLGWGVPSVVSVGCQKTQSAESKAQSVQFMKNKRYALCGERSELLLTTDHG